MPRKHRCDTNRCHRCPSLGGQIMPGCMGMAAGNHCTCPPRWVVERDLKAEIDSLKKTVKFLMDTRCDSCVAKAKESVR